VASLAASCLDDELFADSVKYYQELIPMYQRSRTSGGIGDDSGHEVNLEVQLARRIRAGASYFHDVKGLDDGADFRRLQLDVAFKF